MCAQLLAGRYATCNRSILLNTALTHALTILSDVLVLVLANQPCQRFIGLDAIKQVII